MVKHHKTGRWDKEATVIQQRKDRLSYILKNEHGQTFIRGRRLLKPKPRQITPDRVLRSHLQRQEEETSDTPNQRIYPSKPESQQDDNNRQTLTHPQVSISSPNNEELEVISDTGKHQWNIHTKHSMTTLNVHTHTIGYLRVLAIAILTTAVIWHIIRKHLRRGQLLRRGTTITSPTTATNYESNRRIEDTSNKDVPTRISKHSPWENKWSN